MNNGLTIKLNHAHVDGATFNLKKCEARIVLSAYLTPDIMKLHDTLRRMALTEQPLIVTIETLQMEMDLNTDTGELTD